MSNVVVSELITLDGVIEGPGEEPGFDRAGWAFQFDRGAEGNTFKFEEIRAAGTLLLGRVTYEGFAAAWPTMEGTGEFGEKMNGMPKYVVSTKFERADWENSTRLFATADAPSTLRLANIVKAGDTAILTYQPARV
jgi:dihydrofolate reductase